MERAVTPNSVDEVSSWHSEAFQAFLKKDDNQPGPSSGMNTDTSDKKARRKAVKKKEKTFTKKSEKRSSKKKEEKEDRKNRRPHPLHQASTSRTSRKRHHPDRSPHQLTHGPLSP